MELLQASNLVSLKNVSGIYKIIIKDKCYIGSSKNIRARLIHHINDLKRNAHHNKTMQNCFNKYGSSNTYFELVEKCTCENLLIREKYWIDSLAPYMNHIKDPLHITMDAISKWRLSAPLKKYHATHESASNKAVYQYDLDGNYIAVYKSASAASRVLHCSYSTIAAAARGDISVSNGYQWFYEYKKNVSKIVYKTKKSKYQKRKRHQSFPEWSKKVYQYTLDGIFVAEYPSIRAAERMFNCNRAIGSCISNPKKYKSAHGYLWRTKKEFGLEYCNNSKYSRIKSITSFNIFTGEETVWPSIASFVRTLNSSKFDIQCATVTSYIRKCLIYNHEYLIKYSDDKYFIKTNTRGVFNLKTNTYYFNTKNAQKHTGIDSKTIAKLCDTQNSDWKYLWILAREKLRESGKPFEEKTTLIQAN